MIDCHGIMKRLWEYLDGELPPDEADRIRDHLAMCARCYPQYRHQLAFLALVSRAAAATTQRPTGSGPSGIAARKSWPII